MTIGSTNSQQREEAIHEIYSTATYCLNLETNEDKEKVLTFLNLFFSLQGPEFFNQLSDEKQLKAYAGVVCDIWKNFTTLKYDNDVSFHILDHPYNENMSFVTIITNDCSYILKTAQHILKKNDIPYKNMIYPVIYTNRNKDQKLLNFVDAPQENENTNSESIIHFLTLKKLSEGQKSIIEQDFRNAYKELQLIHLDERKILNILKEISENNFDHSTQEYTFLKWIIDGRYSYYGYRYLKNIKENFIPNEHSFLGLFKDEKICKNLALTPVVDEKTGHQSINICKSSLRANINRASRYDCLEIPEHDKDGKFLGLHQFIGVFTTDFFASSALSAPLANQKANAIMHQFGYHKTSFSAKFLTQVLNSISLDLFFQLSQNEIADICRRVLEMQKNVVTYTKTSNDNDHTIALIFMPTDKYSFQVKEKIKHRLEEAYEGQIYSEHVLVNEYSFARIIFVVDKNTNNDISITNNVIENFINLLCETWEEKLEHLTDIERAHFIAQTFPETYKEKYPPQKALIDINKVILLCKNKTHIFDIQQSKDKKKLHIYSATGNIPLSGILPILEKFGIQVFSETTYKLMINEFKDAVLQVFDIHHKQNEISLLISQNKKYFLDALEAVWMKKTTNDNLNALIILENIPYREVDLLRAFIKAQKQMGIPFSYEYIVDILCQHHAYGKSLIQFFVKKFSPETHNIDEAIALFKKLEEYCNNLKRSDDDHILRGLLNLINASLRTNFFQPLPSGEFKKYISIKFDSSKISFLPKPKPLYEIFVYSPTMEGVHLRSGKVARGGLRWSDRYEDFRSEILGLMKSQIVKNSVIVPFGSKGGFVVKNYTEEKSSGATPQELRNIVIENYQNFISGLLDITDNLISGKIEKPKNCICLDDNDPYLVVAADKGTATFSDNANEVSEQYNFWLYDAFASGGSHGYDHKKMGITAKGAWTCIQRHFIEKNIDIQKDSISVIGVGDMSGDVFGNGMLLSKKIKLVGAFNHEHIFLDPNPDTEKSFLERKKLFNTPGSKWSDYKKEILSLGGGIFRRDQKWIEISPEIGQLLGITEKQVTPEKLVQYMLKNSCDLLFFGGIGTFIKASDENNLDVQDKTNDNLRVNANEVKAKVIGEGANLGITQKGRIEFQINGGRINTDAVDNSAGVNCSDYEVNIKILLNILIEKKLLTFDERNNLLEEMTDDIERHVLFNNHTQSFLLSVLENSTKHFEKAYLEIMEEMVDNKTLPLDIPLENLPSTQVLIKRKETNQSFTRPELATIVAYRKIHLYSNLLEDFNFDENEHFFKQYFPEKITKKYGTYLSEHPLKKEIICNYVANFIINNCGILFVHNISKTSGKSESKITEILLKIIDICSITKIWDTLSKLKNTSIEKQYVTWHKIVNILRQLVFCYIRNEKTMNKHSSSSLKPYFALLDDFNETMSERKFKQNIDKLYFYPLILEALAQQKNIKVFSTKTFLKAFFKVNKVFDFDFLIDLTRIPKNSAQWERSTLFQLNDDLLEKIVKSILTTLKYDIPSQWIKHNKSKIALFSSHLDAAKVHFKTDENPIALSAYISKQIDCLT